MRPITKTIKIPRLHDWKNWKDTLIHSVRSCLYEAYKHKYDMDGLWTETETVSLSPSTRRNIARCLRPEVNTS